MKGNLLKKINERTPDFIKKIFAHQIRNKVIKNKVFLDTICEIQSFENLSNEEKNKVHISKLKDILIYSYENIEYYKSKFDEFNFNPYEFSSIEEMNKIPAIKKQDVINNFDKMVSRDSIDYYTAYTGGSTGKPLKILLDTDSIYKEKAYVYNYWSKFGYDFRKDRIVTLRGVEFKGKIYKYNPIDNQIILNPFKLNDELVDDYVKIIDKFKPKFIHGYASAIYNLCRLMKKKNIKLKTNIECIFFVSENVETYEKEYIEETLNCKSNIFYGHSERAIFAEYIDNGYHFNQLYTHMILEKSENIDEFNLKCTGLINKKMPLINYIPDDKVVMKNNKMMVYGHWDKEQLIGQNDEKISIASINFHNKIFDKIKVYQFRQEMKGYVELAIVEDEKISEKDLVKMEEAINAKLKGIIDVQICVVEQIELTKRGKLKKIIQSIES